MQEIILLQEIDKMRVRVTPEQHDSMAVHNMQTLSEPKQWRLPASNTTVQVVTTGTTRYAPWMTRCMHCLSFGPI